MRTAWIHFAGACAVILAAIYILFFGHLWLARASGTVLYDNSPYSGCSNNSGSSFVLGAAASAGGLANEIDQAYAFAPQSNEYIEIYDNAAASVLLGTSTPSTGDIGGGIYAFPVSNVPIISGHTYKLTFINNVSGSIIACPTGGLKTFIYGDPNLHSLIFSQPLADSTTTDFSAWNLQVLGTAPTSTDEYIATVFYSQNSDFSGQFSDSLRFSGVGEFIMPGVSKTNALIFPPLSDGQVWYAAAELDDASNLTVVATSSAIQFTVNYATVGTTGTSTPSGSTGALSSFFTTLSRKPPFGYFTAIKAALSGIATSSDTVGLVSDQVYTAGQVIFDPIRAGLLWIIWILAAFWLYHRLRNLDL